MEDAVRERKQTHKEVFIPLSHPPGEAQVDFGFADVILDGEQTKVTLFVMTLLTAIKETADDVDSVQVLVLQQLHDEDGSALSEVGVVLS